MRKLYHFLGKKSMVAALLIVSLLGAESAGAQVPNDSGYADQQTMWNQIGAPLAWDFTTGSSRAVVAVIDSGADAWHQDLASNIWTNPYEIPDNGKDDDDNGYIDDVHGWNFVEDNNDPRTSVVGEVKDKEAVRHGTLVAGLIGSVGNNGQDGVGVNWRVKIMPLRAINSNGEGDYAVVVRAIDYAVANGAEIISMSFVGDVNDLVLREHLYRAYQKGVLIVAAAGNHRAAATGDLDSNPLYPACYDAGDTQNWILTVGGVDSSDRLSRFSNFGACVDLVAPAEGIFSTERYAPAYGYPNTFGGPWKGTSFATPLVAGAAALIKSLHPEWGPDELVKVLRENADAVDTVNPLYTGKMGAGRLNVAAATLAAQNSQAAAVIDSRLYFFKGNEVDYVNVGQGVTTTLVRLPGATVKSIFPYDIYGGTKRGVVALVERMPYYYVRFIKDSGELWREFLLPIPLTRMRRPAVTVKKLKVLPDRDGFAHLLLEEFDAGRNITTLVEFDVTGKKLKQVVIKGSLADWAVSRTTDMVVYAQLIKNKLTIRQLSWHGSEHYEWIQNGVRAVEALRLAEVGEGHTEEPVILLRSTQGIKLVNVDIVDGAARESTVPLATSKPLRLLLLKSLATNETFTIPYGFDGGIFQAWNDQGVVAAEIKLPQFKGTVD